MKRLADLQERLQRHAPCLIAVSGGLDSRFLASVAARAGVDAHLVHFHGPHQTPAETAFAQGWLKRCGQPYTVLDVSPLDHDKARLNTRQRCYYCKQTLFTEALRLAGELAVDGVPRTVMDGSNTSDLGEFRPGRKALTGLGVVSPMAEAGLAKQDIRYLAGELGVEWALQPARSCLMTRFAYDLAPTEELLDLVGRAEDALAELGFVQFRVRVVELGPDGAPLFHLHVDRLEAAHLAERRERVLAALEALGLPLAEIVATGGVSGYFDH